MDPNTLDALQKETKLGHPVYRNSHTTAASLLGAKRMKMPSADLDRSQVSGLAGHSSGVPGNGLGSLGRDALKVSGHLKGYVRLSINLRSPFKGV